MITHFSLTRLFPFLFADDIFLSYSRKDGNAYTAALGRELTAKKYKVFFDHYGTPPGQELPKEVIAKALSAKMFILIASDEALASRHVRSEVELFVDKKHKKNKGVFQCINFGKFDKTEWVNNSKLNTISYISEEDSSKTNNKPSQTVINFINDSFIYNKSNYKLRRAAALSGIVLFLMAAISIYFTRQAVASSVELKKQTILLDSVQVAEQKARTATELAQNDLKQAQKSRDSIDELRVKTQEQLASATIKLTTATTDLLASRSKLSETNTRLTLSNQNLKEITKQTALEETKANFNAGKYSAAYENAFGALKNNQAVPGKAGSDFCNTAFVTTTDLGLLFVAGISDNLRGSTPGEIGVEEVKFIKKFSNKILLQSDKGLHVYYEDPDYWNEIEFPFLGETQAFEEISSLNGILSIEKNDYSDPDSLFNVRLYIEKGKEIKLVFTDKIQCDYSSWYPQFYIIPDEINEYVALLAQPQYNNKDSDHILKAWFYKIEKDGLKKINETALFVNAGTQISTMSLSKKNGFEIFTTRGTVNEVIQLSGQTFATKKINRISDDYKQLQSFSYSDEVYSLLEKDGSLFIGSKMSAKSNNELYRIDWNGLDTIVNPEVSFEPAGKDTLLLSLYGKCKSTSQTKMFKLFCKKITDEKKFLVFKEKEIGLSDNFIYDPVSNCSYFSRGSKMYFQPIFSDLEFDLDNLPGNAGGIHCINDQIIVFYDCQYDAGVPCVSFAAFNKPVIKKIPDSLAISLLTENSTASNFYFSTGLSFDNDLNFYKGHTNVSGFESQHCPNADSLYTFFKWVDPSRRNKVRIFSNPEELENIGEEYPNPDPEGWMDNQVLLSPDGRWIFVRIEDKLEVVDLIQGGNLGLNLNMPEINIGHVISNSFAISGEYLFLLYDNFIYRLNMPSLIARKLQQ